LIHDGHAYSVNVYMHDTSPFHFRMEVTDAVLKGFIQSFRRY